MIVQNVLLSDEGYTHQNWVYRNVCVGFSRIYYVIDGEAYYEERGNKVRLKKGHLYLTPVKKPFDLYENPDDKLLHTYSHITTNPPVTSFTELCVKEGTPLFDAVTLWRKYIHTNSPPLLGNVLQFVLSCMEQHEPKSDTVAEQTKRYLDGLIDFSFDMNRLQKELAYSREHVTRSFAATYHTTPKQYVHLRRMNAALEGLLRGDSVKQVADRVGYASSYSFSKAFKKHFGLSPEKYLQTLKA